MDYSDYTLVSFGDSFTFGQGAAPRNNMSDARYRNACNESSYTRFLKDALGFKDYINLGVMGGSNETSCLLLSEFMRNNDTRKCFFLINFTAPERHDFLQRVTGRKDEFTYHYGTIRTDYVHMSDEIRACEYRKNTGIYNTKRAFWENYFMNVYTPEYAIFKTIQIYYNIKLLLSDRKHLMFDLLNDAARMIDKESVKSGFITPNIADKFGYSQSVSEKGFTLDSNIDLFNKYLTDIKLNNNYLSYVELNEKDSIYQKMSNNTTVTHINAHINNLARVKKLNYISNFKDQDGHWNMDGQSQISEVLINYIKNGEYND
jgi:hypothetical protein